jgi:molybdate transport system ATP-binding protein
VSVRKRLSPTFELETGFCLQPGINILFGPSGAGKTTLLDCIAGLSTPDSGRIALGNSVLFDSQARSNVPVTSRKIGYVFQDLALFPHMTAAANIEYGLSGFKGEQRRGRRDDMLASLGITHLRDRLPAQLSGGERQRVALARALATDPSILLLDEPLAALDLPVRMKIADDLRRLIQDRPIPVLYVTHNRDEVFMLGENLLVMEKGRLIAQGTPHQVLSAPRGETVAQLTGFENIFDAQVTSVHEERGTMTCRIQMTETIGDVQAAGVAEEFSPRRKPWEQSAEDEQAPEGRQKSSTETFGAVELETPLVRTEVASKLRVGISAGDILLATSAPVGLSARNVLPGKLISLDQRDAIVTARVDCGIELAVHLTLGARDSLGLAPGRQVWVVVKTHSCHLLDQSS